MAFRIKNLDHFAHAVYNLDEAIEFWTSNFGVTVKSQAVLEAKLDWVRSQGGWVHPLGEATLRWAKR